MVAQSPSKQVGKIAGATHVFLRNEVVAIWEQLGQFIEGQIFGDWSGTFVDLSADGQVLVIGAPRNGPNGSNAGRTRVFKSNEEASVQYESQLVMRLTRLVWFFCCHFIRGSCG